MFRLVCGLLASGHTPAKVDLKFSRMLQLRWNVLLPAPLPRETTNISASHVRYLFLGKVGEFLLHGRVEQLLFQALDGDGEVQQGHLDLQQDERVRVSAC